jgi:hypothetical protein
MMRKIDRRNQANDLVEIADLVVHYVFRPITGLYHVGTWGGGVCGVEVRHRFYVLIEVSGFDAVYGFGMADVVDDVYEASGKANLAGDAAIVHRGNGGDDGLFLRLQGDSLGIQLRSEPGGERGVKFAANFYNYAESIGIDVGFRSNIGQARSAQCQEKDTYSYDHCSMF